MGNPAARVLDWHSCPELTGQVPHVGGPILAGCWTVFIDGRPAARRGDELFCQGPTDLIDSGSGTVWIQRLKAARVGDRTAHKGEIITGSPTVFIGG